MPCEISRKTLDDIKRKIYRLSRITDSQFNQIHHVCLSDAPDCSVKGLLILTHRSSILRALGKTLEQADIFKTG